MAETKTAKLESVIVDVQSELEGMRSAVRRLSEESRHNTDLIALLREDLARTTIDLERTKNQMTKPQSSLNDAYSNGITKYK